MVALDGKRILRELGIEFERYEEWEALSAENTGGRSPAASDERQSVHRLIRLSRAQGIGRHSCRLLPADEEPLGAAGIR